MNKSDTIIFIRSLLIAHKELYNLSEFLFDFEDEVGYSLPSFGYGSVLEFLNSIPNTLQVISVRKNFYLKLVESQKSAHIRSAVVRSVVCSAVRKKITQAQNPLPLPSAIVNEPPSLIDVKTLEERSKKGRFGKKKKKSGLAPGTLNHFSLKSSEGKSEGQGVTTSKRGLCISCVELESDFSRLACIDKCLTSVALGENDLTFVNLKDHVKVGDSIEICVAEVCNPHKFVLHLRKFKFELAELMRSMMHFYSLYFNNYAVREFKFKKNSICAVFYETQPGIREWYRAKILHYGTQRSTVLLMDYGLTAYVESRDIRYLDRGFGDLPVQAINGHLANVKPSEGNYWSVICNKRFFELAFEKDFMAEVIDLDNKKRWLSVALSHGRGNGDVDIRYSLVGEEHAVFDIDSHEKKSPPKIFDSINSQGLLRPENMGIIRKLRSFFGRRGKKKNKKNNSSKVLNKKMKEISGTEESDHESSSN